MVFLHDKFNGALDRKISAKEIWNHLMEMYDLNALVRCLHVCCYNYNTVKVLFLLVMSLYLKDIPAEIGHKVQV